MAAFFDVAKDNLIPVAHSLIPSISHFNDFRQLSMACPYEILIRHTSFVMTKSATQPRARRGFCRLKVALVLAARKGYVPGHVPGLR
ncbi:hypothetical protein [Pontitalea aquivivens]|uniref:hypothetical protein n=1 Tax=Pontitalea aquivivens TaxID=3388663 RepID=UPI0039710382